MCLPCLRVTCWHASLTGCRLVKTEVLPWAYWNLMTKGFVPWSEVKNALKSVKARLQQWQEAPASLPLQ